MLTWCSGADTSVYLHNSQTASSTGSAVDINATEASRESDANRTTHAVTLKSCSPTTGDAGRGANDLFSHFTAALNHLCWPWQGSVPFQGVGLHEPPAQDGTNTVQVERPKHALLNTVRAYAASPRSQLALWRRSSPPAWQDPAGVPKDANEISEMAAPVAFALLLNGHPSVMVECSAAWSMHRAGCEGGAGEGGDGGGTVPKINSPYRHSMYS